MVSSVKPWTLALAGAAAAGAAAAAEAGAESAVATAVALAAVPSSFTAFGVHCDAPYRSHTEAQATRERCIMGLRE